MKRTFSFVLLFLLFSLVLLSSYALAKIQPFPPVEKPIVKYKAGPINN